MLRRNHWISIASLLFLFTQTACYMAGPERREEIVKTFALKPGCNITVENTNGFINLEGWDQEKVEVTAVKSARGYDIRDAEENLKRLEVSFDQTGNDLKIETRYPRRLRFGGSVSYTLRVPRKANVDLQTTNGHVSVSEIDGKIRVHSTNGALKAENIAGSLRGSTTNGSITATLLRFSGDDIHLSSTNGAIRLSLPDEVNAEVSAHTTNGSVRTDFPITTRGEIGKHSLKGTLGRGGAQIELGTTNGSISILRGSSAAA